MNKKLKNFYINYVIGLLKNYPDKWVLEEYYDQYSQYKIYIFVNDKFKINIDIINKSIVIYFLQEKKDLIEIPIIMDFYLNFKFIKYYRLMKKSLIQNKINEFIQYTGDQRSFKLMRILKNIKK